MGSFSMGAICGRAAINNDGLSYNSGMTRRDLLAVPASATLLRSATPSIQALTFDVFGTVTDWRSAVIRDGEELSRVHGMKLDWGTFADQWRASYWPEMNRVRQGEIPWVTLDTLHRHALESMLAGTKFPRLSEQELEWFTGVWHRLLAWPEVPNALKRLRSRYTVATLSNATISMLVDISRYAGLEWDCLLSAELARHFKPEREAYLKAAELLGLEPGRILMVAAHYDDLDGAHAAGFRTAYVQRPREYGPGYKMPPRPSFDFDFEARDLGDLARQLNT